LYLLSIVKNVFHPRVGGHHDIYSSRYLILLLPSPLFQIMLKTSSMAILVSKYVTLNASYV